MAKKRDSRNIGYTWRVCNSVAWQGRRINKRWWINALVAGIPFGEAHYRRDADRKRSGYSRNVNRCSLSRPSFTPKNKSPVSCSSVSFFPSSYAFLSSTSFLLLVSSDASETLLGRFAFILLSTTMKFVIKIANSRTAIRYIKITFDCMKIVKVIVSI